MSKDSVLPKCSAAANRRVSAMPFEVVATGVLLSTGEVMRPIPMPMTRTAAAAAAHAKERRVRAGRAFRAAVRSITGSPGVASAPRWIASHISSVGVSPGEL